MWDKEYSEYIEVPEDYWVFSSDVEYSSNENDND